MAEERQHEEAKSALDYQDLAFTPVGFLNYIIRYGGGATPIDVRKAAANKVGKGGPIPFRSLREFVLKTSDKSKFVQNFFDQKFFTYVSQKKHGRGGTRTTAAGNLNAGGGTELKGQLALETSKALQCPAIYKTLPKVEIITEESVIASNNPFTAEIEGTGVSVIIQDITIDKNANPKVEAGGIATLQGRMTVQFISMSKTKEILATIADNRLLNWMFDVKNDYRVSLSNEKKTQNFIGKNAQSERAYYEALLHNKLSYITKTIKYEMTQWKPHQNRVTFNIQFAESSKNRELITKSSETLKPNSTPSPNHDADIERWGSQKQYKEVLSVALIKQMEKNQSLFSYSFMKNKSEDDNFLYRFANTAVGNDDTSTERNAEPSDYKPHGEGSRGIFFLFRSLLVATIQTYFEDTTLLDGDKVGDIFFDKEAYDRMYIGLDEDIVPTEVREKEAAWWDRNDDIRNTFETIVVDNFVFTKFMDGLIMTHPKMTLDFFLEKMFNVLLPLVLKANIKNSTFLRPDPRPSFNNKSEVAFHLSPEKISVIQAERLVRFLTVSNDRMAASLRAEGDPRNKVNTLDVAGSIMKQGGTFGIDENLWGKNRFKQLLAKDLQTSIAAPHETADESFVMLLYNNTPPDRATAESNKQAQLKEKNDINKLKQGELLNQGIIRVNWYDRKDPAANVNYRFASKEQESPFQFSVLDNKHLASIKRNNAGATQFFNNVYTAKFSVYDYLGIEPLLLDFYFPPEFFGFDSDPAGGEGIGDAFGLSGVYKVSKVSIAYSSQKPMFITSVELTVNQKYPTPTTKTPPRSASTTPSSTPTDAAGSASAKVDQETQNKINKLEVANADRNIEFGKTATKIAEQQALIAKIEKDGPIKTSKMVMVGRRDVTVTETKTLATETKKLNQLIAAQDATAKAHRLAKDKVKKLRKDAQAPIATTTNKPRANKGDC